MSKVALSTVPERYSMNNTHRVAVIVGSLRSGAFSRSTAEALIDAAPDSLELEIVEIGDLPLSNQDLESPPPAAWTAFRGPMKGMDAVLFVTPEHNRSVPAALTNAVDVGSRPYGKGVWDNKPGAVVSVSPGAIGAFGANHHLRQSLVFVNMPVMAQPEAYIGGAKDLFDEQGALKNESTRAFMEKFTQAFAAWITMHVKVPVAA